MYFFNAHIFWDHGSHLLEIGGKESSHDGFLKELMQTESILKLGNIHLLVLVLHQSLNLLFRYEITLPLKLSSLVVYVDVDPIKVVLDVPRSHRELKLALD